MVEELFRYDIIPSDEKYCIFRDEPRLAKTRAYLQNLWADYYPYADKDFLKQLPHDFDARFWEMYLTCTLLQKSFNVIPKQKRVAGPDIKIIHASTIIWVEAVTPTSGDLSKPDSVRPPRGFVVQNIPDDQMILRFRSVIHDKYCGKYFKYLKKGIIKNDDCYIIALNGCRLPWRGADLDLPRIVRSVFPFGPPVITVDTVSHELVNRGYQHRPYLLKASGEQVDTDIFVKPEYSHISAVMSSDIDADNPIQGMGDDFIIVHNPLASPKLPHDFPKVGREYKAELSGNTINLFTKNLK